EEAGERQGERRAFWFDGEWHGSGGLRARGARLGAGLVERGIRPGDRVVVLMEDSPDVPVIYDAILRAGGVIVPAISLLSTVELHGLLLDSGATAAITSPAFRATVDAAAEGVPSLRWVASVGDELDALAAGTEGQIVPRADDDLAAVVYTGG